MVPSHHSQPSLSVDQMKHFDDWYRPDKALPPPHSSLDGLDCDITMTALNPCHLVQDIGTDCSVVASLCAIVARTEKGHSNILSKVFHPFDLQQMEPRVSPNGKYVFRFNINGTFRKVIIDDFLPVSQNKRLIHVVDRNNPTLLWPALLEKAYISLFGSYGFPGSNSATDLWILTGWLPEQIFLTR